MKQKHLDGARNARWVETEAQWQPIETAPKDRTKVLVFEPADEESDARINVCDWHASNGPYSDEGWVESHGEGYARFYPTHWMPLPEPPHVP